MSEPFETGWVPNESGGPVVERADILPPGDDRVPTWVTRPGAGGEDLYCGFAITRLPDGRARYFVSWYTQALMERTPEFAIDDLRRGAIWDAERAAKSM